MTRRKSPRCEWCRAEIKRKGRGRVPRFCSPSHRQLAFQRRKWQRPHPVDLMARDLNRMAVRSFLRQEIWEILAQAGLVPPSVPPPLPRKARGKPDLRIVGPGGLTNGTPPK